MEIYLEFEKPLQALEKRIQELKELSKEGTVEFEQEINALQSKLISLTNETFKNLSSWQKVQLSRHPSRPYSSDYLSLIFDSVSELHGDRLFGDDQCLWAGMGELEGIPCFILAQQKGRTTKQKMERNFGMMKPEGYRKALRIMDLAHRFHIPLIQIIDTPGAYPGIEAEERGQAEAIARCILKLFSVEAPIISCIIGEGGSGGALALGVADRVLVQEYATYSVISPESCASILWSDSSQAERASQLLKLTSEELIPLGVLDEVVEEPIGGAHRNWNDAAQFLKKALLKNLKSLKHESIVDLLKTRSEKFRNLGTDFIEQPKTSAKKKK